MADGGMHGELAHHHDEGYEECRAFS